MFVINQVLNENLSKEINDKYSNPEQFNIAVQNKTEKLKDYEYAKIFMGNYGEDIFNHRNEKIGVKLNENEYATVLSFKNSENNLCNFIQIKEFNEKE
jgi:hypothetical protein